MKKLKVIQFSNIDIYYVKIYIYIYLDIKKISCFLSTILEYMNENIIKYTVYTNIYV